MTTYLNILNSDITHFFTGSLAKNSATINERIRQHLEDRYNNQQRYNNQRTIRYNDERTLLVFELSYKAERVSYSDADIIIDFLETEKDLSIEEIKKKMRKLCTWTEAFKDFNCMLERFVFGNSNDKLDPELILCIDIEEAKRIMSKKHYYVYRNLCFTLDGFFEPF